MQSPSILALDLSKKSTGYAFGRVGEVPRSGAVSLGSERSTQAEIGRSLLKWMTGFMSIEQFDRVAIEAAWAGTGGRSTETFLLLNGLQFMAQTIALLKAGREADLVKVQTARKTFTGRGQYGTPDEGKYAVQQRCLELGWLTAESLQADRADALCVWAHVASELDKSLKFKRARA